MQKLLTKDRWIILVSAIIVWTCTAFPSLWAIFQADAAAAYGITLEESAILFPMCTAFFGIFSIVGPFVTDMFGNVNAGANMGIVSLYSTISSVVAPMLVTLFTPALG